MMNRRNRFVSFALVLAMLLGMLPTMAVAADVAPDMRGVSPMGR